jgi:hypothetical protein
MTDSGWRKRQIALDKKAEDARELGFCYDIHLCSPFCTQPMCVAEAVQAEPVAWGVFEGNLHDMFFSQEEAQEMADLKGTNAEVRPLYAIAQRTWVGLTDKERSKIWRDVVKWGDPSHDDVDLMKAIEAKLRELNHD